MCVAGVSRTAPEMDRPVSPGARADAGSRLALRSLARREIRLLFFEYGLTVVIDSALSQVDLLVNTAMIVIISVELRPR